MRRLAILFLVLIAYGSLYPFTGWQALHGSPPFGFLASLPDYIEKADVAQNLLAYMPFGLFLVAALRRRFEGGAALGLALLAGGLLSLTMESLQQWLPSRDASLADLALNLLGTLAGGMLALVLDGHSWAGARLLALRRQWLRGGTLANLGLGALALWALSQTSPLVPSFDVGQLRSALSPLYRGFMHPARIEMMQLVGYACYLAGLGLMLRLLVRPERSALWCFSLGVALVFGLKVLMQSRQLGPEAVLGAAAAWLALALSARMSAPRTVARAGVVLLATGFITSELTPGGYGFVEFNWLPLAGQMASISGLQNILEVSWPFFAMAIFARLLAEPARWRHAALAGGGLVAALVFGLEWWQQALPGRHGDITQVMLAWAGWMLPWTFQGSDGKAKETTPS